MTRNLVFIAIAVLVVIALVLGYKIYQQQTLNKQPSPPRSITSNNTASPSTKSGNQNNASPASQSTDSDEQAVLNFPGPNASSEELKRFSETVAKYAKEADISDISGCKPNPIALKIKLGAEFKIKNADNVDRQLSLRGKEKFSIPAQTTKTFTANFDRGNGVYGYTCNNNAENNLPVGVFFVIQ